MEKGTTRKEGPIWRAFPLALFCHLSVILERIGLQVPASNRKHIQFLLGSLAFYC
jgi:hypothetical protein